MVLSAKQKRMFNVILISVLIAVILSGIGLGIYFILKDKDELSARQKKFGNDVNIISSKVINEDISLSMLPTNVDKSKITCVTSSYVLVESQEGPQKIYSLESGDLVSVSDLVLYDKVKLVYENLAVVSYQGVDKLINLVTGNLICLIDNAEYVVNGGYLLLKTQNGESLKYKTNDQDALSYVAVLFNAKTNEAVKKISVADGLIDVSISENYFVLSFKEKTELYGLNHFKILKSFENTSINNSNSNIFNLTGKVGYFLTTYYRAFELSKKVILIERVELTTDKKLTTITEETKGGLKQNYKLSYLVYDAVSDELIELESNNKVFKPVKVDLNEDYFALLAYQVENKQSVDLENVDICYYSLEENVNGQRNVYPVVSYDYLKYGLVCGFSGTKLLTQGGENSLPITFKGESSSLIKTNSKSVISGTNNKGVLIETNALGQKRILTNNAKVLVDGIFLNVSPFDGNYAIAKNSDGYYVVSSAGTKTEIKEFAKEFEQFVFSGIGLYFTNGTNNKYNAYKLDGTKVYENAEITIKNVGGNQELLLYVNDGQEKLVSITPVLKSRINLNTYVEGEVYLNGFTPKEFGVNQLKTLTTQDKLEATNVNVDSVFGYGEKEFNIIFNISEIESKFKAYQTLTNQEKSLIPAFDNNGSQSYLSQGKELIFDGVYFIANNNVLVAIIRLVCENKNYYVINLALKDVYLKNLTASVNRSDNGAKLVYANEIVDAKLDFNKNYMPAIALNGVGLTYFDDGVNNGRVVNYASAGYDGGLLIAYDTAKTLNLSFVLSNIYVGSGLKTDFISNEKQYIDYGKYSVEIQEENGKKYIIVSATQGYFLTNFDLSTYKKEASIYSSYLMLNKTHFNNICTTFKMELTSHEASYIKLSNVNLVERYALIKFVNYDKGIIDQSYSFYGYGDDLGKSNPAILGFSEFDRRQTVSVPQYRVGYVFNGYNFNNKTVVDFNGKFIANWQDLDFNYRLNQPQVIEVVAEYTAKQFNVYFTNGIDALAGEERVVTFDSVIENFPVVSKVGYELDGWYDAAGNKFTADTIYRVDSHVTLSAKWKAEEYELKFDLNLKEYNGISINGYDYNVKSAQFAKAFKGFRAGANFKNVVKTITYDSLYGELPQIMGQGNNQDVYMFIGWFENSSNQNKGQEYTNANKVTLDSARTLYAHYTKEIYSVKLEVNQDVLDKFKEIKYSGATSQGEASSFSTISGNAENLLVFNNGCLVLYALQAKTINIGIDLLPGFIVEEMQLDYAGNKYYYDQSALSPINNKGHGFTDPDAGSDNITVSATNQSNYSLNVGLTMTEGQSAQDYDASIKLAVAPNLSNIKLEVVNGANGDEIIENKDVVFNDYKEFKLNPGVSTIDGKSIAHSYLKKVTITNSRLTRESWEFSLNYEYNDISLDPANTDLDAVIVDLEETNFKVKENWKYNYQLSGGGSGSGSRTQTYSYPKLEVFDPENQEVFLDVIYNVATSQYNYAIGVNTKGGDYTITAEFEDIKGKAYITVQSAELSDGTSGGGNVKINDGNQSSIEESIINEGGFKSYNIKPAENTFITKVTFVYGDIVCAGKTEEVSIPLCIYETNFMFLANQYFKRSSVMQTTGGANNSIYLSSTTSNINLKATGVSLEWRNDSQILSVKVGNISTDLKIVVECAEYKMIQLNVPSKAKLFLNDNAGVELLDEVDFKAEQDLGTQQLPQTYLCKKSDSLYVAVYFGDSAKNVEWHKFTTDVNSTAIFIPEIAGYKTITAEGSGDQSQIPKIENRIEVTVPKGCYESIFVIEEITRKFIMESYIQESQDSFVPDNGEVFKKYLTEDFSLTYYSSETPGSPVTKIYNAYSAFKEVDFKGTGITVNYETELGSHYKLDTAKSGIYEDGAKIMELPNNGLSVQLTEIKPSTYSVRLYYNVTTSYKVVYQVQTTDGKDVDPEGSMPDETLYYNQTKVFGDCGYYVAGYDFKHYTIGGTTYNVGTSVVNLTTTNGGEITVNCVFGPKKFAIEYKDVGLGSSPVNEMPQSTGEKVVIFGDKFAKLTTETPGRTGYSFDGWYSKASGGEKITKETTLDKDLYLTLDEGSVDDSFVLYAGWQAKQYNIAFYDHIDGEKINELSGYTVTFDSTFPTLPTTTRKGHTFIAWVTKLDGQAVTNETVLNYGLFTSMTTDSESVSLYASWSVNKYTITLDFSDVFSGYNVAYDKGQGKLMTDCPLIFDGTRYYESNACKFEFEIFYNGNIMDKLPTIEVTGYNHYISTSSSYDGAIIGDDTTYSEVFDIVYNSTLYVRLGNKKSFNLSVASDIKKYVKSIDFGDYEESPDFETKTSQDFGGDTILKLVMKENKYLEKITLSFNNSMKFYDLAITWDSKTQTLTTTNNQVLVSGADYIQLSGHESNCFEKISIKFSWEDNFWGTAILTFEIKIEFIKNSINVVSTNAQDLTNEIKTYTQFGTNNTAEFKEEFDVVKHTNLNEVLKPYYYSGYTFLGWFKYDEASNKADTSEQVNTSVPVTENFKLVAYYNISATVHQINYYHWSVEEEKYVTRDDLKITVNDSTDYFDATNGSTTSGRAKKIISPATESWPAGYYFAGYVVMAEDTDKSTRLTSSAINPNAGRNVKGSLFSCENMVDFDLHIYATYDKYEFKTTAGGCTISFGDVLPDGTVRKFTTSDVNYVDIDNLGTYNSSINAGMSREAALEIAGYSQCSAGSAEDIVAVIFKNPDGSYGYKNGNSYVFAVAKRINEE